MTDERRFKRQVFARSAEIVQFSESSVGAAWFVWIVGTGWWPKTEIRPGRQRKGWFEL